jgi:hypothetical protein
MSTTFTSGSGWNYSTTNASPEQVHFYHWDAAGPELTITGHFEEPGVEALKEAAMAMAENYGRLTEEQRKFLTRLALRHGLTEEYLAELEQILEQPDWPMRYLLVAMVSETINAKELGYDFDEEKE